MWQPLPFFSWGPAPFQTLSDFLPTVSCSGQTFSLWRLADLNVSSDAETRNINTKNPSHSYQRTLKSPLMHHVMLFLLCMAVKVRSLTVKHLDLFYTRTYFFTLFCFGFFLHLTEFLFLFFFLDLFVLLASCRHREHSRKRLQTSSHFSAPRWRLFIFPETV